MVEHAVTLKHRVEEQLYGDLEDAYEKLRERRHPDDDLASYSPFQEFLDCYGEAYSRMLTKRFGYPVSIDLYDSMKFQFIEGIPTATCRCVDTDCDRAEEIRTFYRSDDNGFWVEVLEETGRDLGMF